MSKPKRNRTLWDRYTKNLRHVLDQRNIHLIRNDKRLIKPCYICPVTWKGYVESDESSSSDLTKEHVPPNSLNGKVICLTDKEFNNNSTVFDKLLFERHTFLYQARSGSTLRIPSTYMNSPDDIEKRLGSKVEMILDLKENKRITFVPNRRDVRGLEIFQGGWGEPGTFNITFPMHAIALTAQLKGAYIKNAYLMAFSKLGYSLFGGINKVINPAMNSIRKALLTRSDYSFFDKIHVLEEYPGIFNESLALVHLPDDSVYLAIPLTINKFFKQEALVLFPTCMDTEIMPFKPHQATTTINYAQLFPDITTSAGSVAYWASTIHFINQHVPSS